MSKNFKFNQIFLKTIFKDSQYFYNFHFVRKNLCSSWPLLSGNHLLYGFFMRFFFEDHPDIHPFSIISQIQIQILNAMLNFFPWSLSICSFKLLNFWNKKLLETFMGKTTSINFLVKIVFFFEVCALDITLVKYFFLQYVIGIIITTFWPIRYRVSGNYLSI